MYLVLLTSYFEAKYDVHSHYCSAYSPISQQPIVLQVLKVQCSDNVIMGH